MLGYRHLRTALVAGLASLIVACGRSPESPSDVVTAAYMAANDGRYSETREYLSADVRRALEGELGVLAGGLKGLWDEATRDGTIERIEVRSEEIRGEGATVRFTIHYRDGDTKDEDEPLIKEDGEWKITIG